MEKRIIGISPCFTVTRNGDVYDAEDNLRSTYVNGDGYIGVSLKDKNGKWTTFGVHRIVAIAYIPREKEERDQVNHLDCDVTNNSADNLEWVTNRENVIHAVIMSDVNRYPKIRLRNAEGVVKDVLNAKQASVETGVTIKEVWYSIKDGVSFNGWSFHFIGDEPRNYNRIWKEIELDADGYPLSKGVKLRCLDNGTILKFQSLADAGRFFNVSASHIFQSIPKNEIPRFFLKKYQVSYLDEDFQTVSNEDIDKAKKHGPREVLAYNIEDGGYSVYSSAKEFYLSNNLSKKAVTHSLAKGKLRKIGNWIPVYYTFENSDRLKAYVESPVSK